ncbi:MAG TPA: hypothetical protein ENJ82_11945 [Bacteroidetes bacterium]|nr:hypothetical protein [Bacteroidota bacterium]
MAIDYIINRACSVKETLGADGIVHLIKSRTRGRTLLRMLMDDGRSQEDALSTTVEMQTSEADGEVSKRQMAVGQMLKEGALLDDYADQCKDCPVNLLESYGCYQSVNYPLSGKAERWLARLAESAVAAGLPDSILISFILDKEISGEHFGKLRQKLGEKYLELTTPLEIVVKKKLLKKITINTDQILDMFFAVGEMQPAHQQFLHFFSGGLRMQESLPNMEQLGKDFQAGLTVGEDGEDIYWVYELKNDKHDDRSIRQVKAFLRALFAAWCGGNSVTIDF